MAALAANGRSLYRPLMSWPILGRGPNWASAERRNDEKGVGAPFSSGLSSSVDQGSTVPKEKVIVPVCELIVSVTSVKTTLTSTGVI
jgi:hypothetical protein